MYLSKFVLSLSVPFFIIAASGFPLDWTYRIPTTDFLLRMIQRRQIDLPNRSCHELLFKVKTRIREIALSPDGGGWKAPVKQTELETSHKNLVFEYRGALNNLQYWPTYQDAWMTVEAVEQNLVHLDFHEISFYVHLVGLMHSKKRPAVAVGSIYDAAFPGIG